MAEISDITAQGGMAAQIKAAIGVHGLWKQRINSAIQTGTSEWKPQNVAPCNLCDFGKWLDNLPEQMRDENYKTVYPIHADFHKEAARVLQMAVSGQSEQAKEATALTSNYGKLTANLTRAMMKWLKDVT